MRLVPDDPKPVGAPSRCPFPQDTLTVMPDGVVVADSRGQVRYLNPRAERLAGVPAAEAVGRPVAEVLPLLDRCGHSWWDAVQPWGGLRTRTGHRERMLLLPGRGHLLVTMSFVRSGRGKPVNTVIVALRDTQARRRAEADATELISLVAHELRSPLTSIRGFSATLLRRWGQFTDPQKLLMLRGIGADAERLSRLINELLDVSRLDTARLTITPQVVDLRAVVGEHLDRLVAGGYERDRFDWAEPRDDALPVLADRDRLDQILGNLLENALRHGAGRVTLSTAAAPGAMVAVTVSDAGGGIPAEHYPLVFTKFWHGTAHGSTGLGLYLVRGLVEAHGGSIVVGRAPEGGALFRFTLPLAPSTASGR